MVWTANRMTFKGIKLPLPLYMVKMEKINIFKLFELDVEIKPQAATIRAMHPVL